MLLSFKKAHIPSIHSGSTAWRDGPSSPGAERAERRENETHPQVVPSGHGHRHSIEQRAPYATADHEVEGSQSQELRRRDLASAD